MSTISMFKTCGNTTCGKIGYWQGCCQFCGFDKTNNEVVYHADVRTRRESLELEYPVTNRQRVIQFNRKVLGIEPRKIGMMPPAEMAFSLTAIEEEKRELSEAYDQGDLVGVIDAIVDLDFFLRGIVYKHGITPELYSKIFAVVHARNMQKVIGKPKESRSELPEDAVKPEGWQSPEDDIRKLLEEAMDDQA